MSAAKFVVLNRRTASYGAKPAVYNPPVGRVVLMEGKAVFVPREFLRRTKMTFLAVISCILGIIGACMFILSLANLLLSEPAGCLATVLFLFPLGGYIGGIVGVGMEFGAPGVAIVNIVGIILGIISRFLPKGSSSSYSSSSGSSFNAAAWDESRRNDPHTCGNCVKWLSRGECRLSGNPTSAGDSCSNWN